MSFLPQDRVFLWAILLLLVSSTTCSIAAFVKKENNIKSAVFLSPKFDLGPGSVANKYYYDVEFPRGHIALKSFNAEVVDEAGNPIPLSETYLHHWLVVRYRQPKTVTNNSQSGIVTMRNSGLCQGDLLGQYYGLGSETRGTATDIPDPFGIEIGNPSEIPYGYEEKWFINVHAIDTRGVQDRMGCTECRCDLYNVTKDSNGKPLSSDYKGGLDCCLDNGQCRLKKGFPGPKRSLYLKYTVKWINWDNFVVPLKIYIFDVTDTLKISSNKLKGISREHNCQVEYQVEPCSKGHKDGKGCLNVKRTSLPMPRGGYVIYGVAHQHAGATGSTLYGQDGKVICSSIARYGKGKEAGNEKGYVVGMSTCYPPPGSIKIFDGETVTLDVGYNNSKRHAGVMGLFYLLVAEKLPHQHINMSFLPQDRVFLWAILLLLVSSTTCSLAAFVKKENNIKSAVFLSPKFDLGPGSVANKLYYDVEFPRGHIALKSFNAEVVDEAGNPIPLLETYLHHWVVIRYRQPKNVTNNNQSGIVTMRNSGLCQGGVLGQYYGLGSETRGTATDIPDPFGIEIGNPSEIPYGYEEKWFINVHVIDTRGVQDRMGCNECRCDLYNVTKDSNGKPLSSDYKGGLDCCPDNGQCRLMKGFQGPKRSLYLKYTVKWINWDNFVVPLKIYIFDVTDTLKISSNKLKGISREHNCQVEYQVEPCSKGHKDGRGCLNVKRTSLPMPSGGYVIYGVAHQHAGGTGSTLYGQDGRVICSSIARYGNGKEAGNEKGYVVGMSTCYPPPGSIKIFDGETLTLDVGYSNSKRHTGVMGLFYLLVAEKLPHQHF
ncbi:uncharacterized protein LOC133286341 [Gastrolobium bilobum]|uniref:uncharacterized protein LOC133286341 n=1 Tax=Gastrolobium bilobum TaxID=150636 RepID=UPI002AB145CC|nr:uncharacterized protein LOC133286341 [Gastrolobium bilobum]